MPKNDANWQASSKGYVGDVAINGLIADERTSGSFAYSGTIFTNDSSLGAWQNIVNNNVGQASASTGNVSLLSDLQTDLTNAFASINALTATHSPITNVNNWGGINTQNGISELIVLDMTGGFQVSNKINIFGDADDVFVFRWDSDQNFANGYNGEVKFQSGGAFVPRGDLTPGNFVHVAGDLNASGGGSTPASPYPQGPRLDDGLGDLITGGSDFSGGGFFTGYWLTTGDPTKNFENSSLSNGVFVGGWYSSNTKFSMTSGTSGVYVAPAPVLIPEPTSALLAMSGLSLLMFRRRRQS
jgi:hypothetical protein